MLRTSQGSNRGAFVPLVAGVGAGVGGWRDDAGKFTGFSCVYGAPVVGGAGVTT